MSTAYVSLIGDDGSAVLDDPLLPFRTLNAAEAVVANADTVEFGNGVYAGADIQCNGATGYALIDKALTLKATNSKQVTLSPSVATAAFRFNGNWAGDNLSVEGIIFDDSDTAPNYPIWCANSSATKGSLTVKDCEFTNPVFYSVYIDSSGDAMDVTLDNSRHTEGGRGLLNAVNLTDGNIIVKNNCSAAFSNKTNSTPAIDIDASAAGVTALVEQFTLNMTIGAGAPVQEFSGVRIRNIDDAVVNLCNLNASAAGSNGSAALAVIDCDDGALTAHRGVIKNNTGSNNANGGFLARVGHDVSGAGDDRANNGCIFNNRFTGGDTFRDNSGHALFFGYVTDGVSSFNNVSQVGLGLLCKGATGGGHFSNVISRFGNSTGVGSAIQSKGSANVNYYGNTIEINDDCFGSAFQAGPDGATNNSGIEVSGNTFNVIKDTASNLAVIAESDNNQVVAYSLNNYLLVNGESSLTNTTPFVIGTTTYATAALYKAGNETDANIDLAPIALVVGGSGGSSNTPGTIDINRLINSDQLIQAG